MVRLPPRAPAHGLARLGVSQPADGRCRARVRALGDLGAQRRRNRRHRRDLGLPPARPRADAHRRRSLRAARASARRVQRVPGGVGGPGRHPRRDRLRCAHRALSRARSTHRRLVLVCGRASARADRALSDRCDHRSDRRDRWTLVGVAAGGRRRASHGRRLDQDLARCARPRRRRRAPGTDAGAVRRSGGHRRHRRDAAAARSGHRDPRVPDGADRTRAADRSRGRHALPVARGRRGGPYRVQLRDPDLPDHRARCRCRRRRAHTAHGCLRAGGHRGGRAQGGARGDVPAAVPSARSRW